MAIKNKSEISTIDNPEFINLEPLDVNPLMSKCQIKVFYLGHNRNGSYINKETAIKMSKTLRGTPIVAAWHEDKEDFGGHGHVVKIDDTGISFSCETVPYGFVSPDAKIWFQNFTDTDEFDNQVEHTYLMTEGYLWTGQFEELTKVIREGQPHSMELDGDSLKGHWATDNNLGVEFFIINDAVFSKLCILGDDVEPCYEGSSVTSLDVDSKFSKSDRKFENTLFTMMQELKNTLNSEGGLNMDEVNEFEQIEEVTPEPEVEETVVEEETEDFNENVDTDSNEDDDKDDSDFELDDNTEEEVVESEDVDFEETSNDDDASNSEFTAEQFTALQEEIDSLRAENQELREFKVKIENQQKKALIDSYFMLSDEDKKDVIDNMSNYSFNDIKAKLAILYVEKNVDFNKIDGQSEDAPSSALSFSLDEDADNEVLSDLQIALRNARK